MPLHASDTGIACYSMAQGDFRDKGLERRVYFFYTLIQIIPIVVGREQVYIVFIQSPGFDSRPSTRAFRHEIEDKLAPVK
jgi:hypothetical protein